MSMLTVDVGQELCVSCATRHVIIENFIHALRKVVQYFLWNIFQSYPSFYVEVSYNYILLPEMKFSPKFHKEYICGLFIDSDIYL